MHIRNCCKLKFDMRFSSNHTRNQEVSSFFDRIARDYSKKVRQSDQWFGFPYQKRMGMACNLVPSGARNILDIGCGSGEALKQIHEMGFTGDYFGCDLSEKLLEQSNIPKSFQFCGDVFSAPFRQKKWDCILMLGVAAYLTRDDLIRHLEYMATHLTSGGGAIISLTNAYSWFVRTRHWVRRFVPSQWLEGKTMGLSFQTSAYAYEEFQNLDFLGVEIQFVEYIYPKGMPAILGKTFAPEWLMMVRNNQHE